MNALGNGLKHGNYLTGRWTFQKKKKEKIFCSSIIGPQSRLYSETVRSNFPNTEESRTSTNQETENDKDSRQRSGRYYARLTQLPFNKRGRITAFKREGWNEERDRSRKKLLEEEEDLDIILGRNKQRRDFCGTFFKFFILTMATKHRDHTLIQRWIDATQAATRLRFSTSREWKSIFI